MPRGDQTGPAGWGPMTGRAAGFCAGYNSPGFANPIPQRRYGMGYGLGFRGGGGRWVAPYAGCGYAAPMATPYGTAPTREQEMDALQAQAKYLEEALADIKKRLSDLETEKTKK